uniref:Uncharacterized protein n=1 Tax=Anguilla anguilla TaxID=7936 RepID=A0A0E9X4I0_ANGAN
MVFYSLKKDEYPDTWLALKHTTLHNLNSNLWAGLLRPLKYSRHSFLELHCSLHQVVPRCYELQMMTSFPV